MSAAILSDQAYRYAEKYNLDPARVQYLIDKEIIK